MSLDFYIESREEQEHDCYCHACDTPHTYKSKARLYHSNITHNLGAMFHEAGVYEILWRGDGLVAGAVVDRLREALRVMKDDPERFKKHDAPNGWGTYDSAIGFLRGVIGGCIDHPEGVIRCCT